MDWLKILALFKNFRFPRFGKISYVFNFVLDTAATVIMLTTEPAMAMMETVTPVQMTANTASSGAVHATLEPVLLETLEPVLETLEPVLEPRPVRQGNLVRGLYNLFYSFAGSIDSSFLFFVLPILPFLPFSLLLCFLFSFPFLAVVPPL
jgi:hypothetical protein